MKSKIHLYISCCIRNHLKLVWIVWTVCLWSQIIIFVFQYLLFQMWTRYFLIKFFCFITTTYHLLGLFPFIAEAHFAYSNCQSILIFCLPLPFILLLTKVIRIKLPSLSLTLRLPSMLYYASLYPRRLPTIPRAPKISLNSRILMLKFFSNRDLNWDSLALQGLILSGSYIGFCPSA